MYLHDFLRKPRDDAVPLQHSQGSLYDVIFDNLFLYSLALTGASSSTLGKADVIVMGTSVPARSALSAHTVPAASAYEFSRKYIVEYLLLAAGGDLVLLVNGVHLIPKLLCNDGWEDIIVFRSLMFYDAYISFVV